MCPMGLTRLGCNIARQGPTLFPTLEGSKITQLFWVTNVDLITSRSINSYSGNSLTLVGRKVATGVLRAGRMPAQYSNCIKVKVVLQPLLLVFYHLLQRDSEDFILIPLPSSIASSGD